MLCEQDQRRYRLGSSQEPTALDKESRHRSHAICALFGAPEEPRDLIFTGKCSIYPIKSRRDRFDEFGHGLIFTRQYRIVLPHTADNVQIRDLWTATSSDDPQLIGRELEIRDVIVSTILGYRSLTVHDFRE